MQESVFIAWSGNYKYAVEISDALAIYGFDSIVGGNVNEDTSSIFVGETIISQMKQCTQAIILLQKKLKDNTISSNLMFEFGYMLNKLNFNKIHVFFIDIVENDIKIPSDIRGVWADFLKSDDQLVQTIIDKFIKRQDMIIRDDKLDIILNSYYYKNLIQSFLSEPKCTGFELAQYFMFYMQAVYFNGDFDDMTSLINEFERSYHYYTTELQIALSFCKTTLELYKVVFSKKNNILAKESMELLSYQYEELIERIASIKDTEYKTWLLADINEHRGFARYYYLLFSDENCDNKLSLYKDVIRYNTLSLEYLDAIEQKSTNHKNNLFFISLLKAYVYRQKALSHKFISDYEDKQMHLAEAHKCFVNAFTMRKLLYNNFSNLRISHQINDNMEMEYYLAMSEIIHFEEYSNSQMRYANEINKYLLSQKNKCDVISSHIKTIEQNLNNRGA